MLGFPGEELSGSLWTSARLIPLWAFEENNDKTKAKNVCSSFFVPRELRALASHLSSVELVAREMVWASVYTTTTEQSCLFSFAPSTSQLCGTGPASQASSLHSGTYALY